MIRPALPLLTAQLVLAASAAAQLAPAPGIRIWSPGQATRVAIQMTGDFEITVDRAHNPERLFFDVRGARPVFFHRGEQSIRVADRIVKQIRVARWQPTVFRIVLDLEQPANFTSTKLSLPDRLIVEVRPNDSAPLRDAAPGSVPGFTPPVSRLQRRPPMRVQPLPPVPQIAQAAIDVARMPDPTRSRDRGSRALAPVTAARTRSGGQITLARALGLKVTRIVIDAGHGGHDTGTAGPGGLLEKDLVLDVAKRLGDLVERRLGAEVVYTRADDTFIPLEDRTRIANERKADLFLSIHANSSPSSSASGIETFYLNFTTNKYALEVAARENAVAQNGMHDLPTLVQLIAKNDKVEESRQFASRVQASLYAFSVRSNPRSKDRGIKQAPFVVLIGARMPSVLCEIGFVSNPRDERMLDRAVYRQKLAEALYKGLSGYASTLSHTQVAVKQD